MKKQIQTDFGKEVFIRGSCEICNVDTFELIKKGEKRHEIICEECKRR